ncbi:MAG: cobalamin-dependent protein [Gammaproteobacteria bacterium]|nr:cobalamin-dependent protein [Gammaproteobacteria bacterium]
MTAGQRRILLVKTALDGHWRGLSVVAHALRDAGFHVIMGGMISGAEIVRAAVDEDVDLVGLNVGGHTLVVERVIGELRAARPQLPIFAGGVLPPSACRRLGELGVETYPPGSSLEAIVDAARRLTQVHAEPDAAPP